MVKKKQTKIITACGDPATSLILGSLPWGLREAGWEGEAPDPTTSVIFQLQFLRDL